MLNKLTAEQELDFIKQIHGADNYVGLFSAVRDAFTLLQTRSQMLLGLATICLTITGFSGPRMAQSNGYSRFFIGFGLCFVLASVLLLIVGPLRLRWITAWRAESLDETLLENLHRRDFKTRCYSVATTLLAIGLTGYVLSLIFYLMTVG